MEFLFIGIFLILILFIGTTAYNYKYDVVCTMRSARHVEEMGDSLSKEYIKAYKEETAKMKLRETLNKANFDNISIAVGDRNHLKKSLVKVIDSSRKDIRPELGLIFDMVLEANDRLSTSNLSKKVKIHGLAFRELLGKGL